MRDENAGEDLHAKWQLRLLNKWLEKDKELNENITSAKFWEYDSRIGRLWNRDVMNKSWISDSALLDIDPTYFIDPNGPDWYKNENSGKSKWLNGDRHLKGFSYLGGFRHSPSSDRNYATLDRVASKKKIIQNFFTFLR